MAQMEVPLHIYVEDCNKYKLQRSRSSKERSRTIEDEYEIYFELLE